MAGEWPVLPCISDDQSIIVPPWHDYLPDNIVEIKGNSINNLN